MSELNGLCLVCGSVQVGQQSDCADPDCPTHIPRLEARVAEAESDAQGYKAIMKRGALTYARLREAVGCSSHDNEHDVLEVAQGLKARVAELCSAQTVLVDSRIALERDLVVERGLIAKLREELAQATRDCVYEADGGDAALVEAQGLRALLREALAGFDEVGEYEGWLPEKAIAAYEKIQQALDAEGRGMSEPDTRDRSNGGWGG